MALSTKRPGWLDLAALGALARPGWLDLAANKYRLAYRLAYRRYLPRTRWVVLPASFLHAPILVYIYTPSKVFSTA